MKNRKTEIPKRYYNVNHGPKPYARTVGQLKKLLEELPDDPRIEDFGEPIELTVYNYGKPDMHLQFEALEEDDG